VLLRFNTFFKVTALLHAEADKKRVLHELAACAPAVPDGPCRVPRAVQCSRAAQHFCSAASDALAAATTSDGGCEVLISLGQCP
jgi:hypothetical protein